MKRASGSLAFSLAALLLTGCGGGDSSPASVGGGTSPELEVITSGTGDDSSLCDTSRLNCGLTGSLYYESSGYMKFPLSHGRGISVRPFRWAITPSKDGSAFAGIDSETIEIFNKDNAVMASFQIDWMSQVGPLTLSPDHQYLAVYHKESDEMYEGLHIYGMSGEIVARYPSENGTEGVISFWNWGTDGTLWITKGDSIYKNLNPISNGEWKLVKHFPNQRPAFIEVSPDHSKLAFTLKDASSQNHVWTMNIDGSNLTQLTTSDKNEDTPTWSPDGRHIAVRYDIAYGYGDYVDVGGARADKRHVYIVPASATLVDLTTIDLNRPGPAFQMAEQGQSVLFPANPALSEPFWLAD